MSENKYDETADLFATRRKKLQEEETQKTSHKSDEERIAELERQKKEVAEEINRLEALQAKQKELEEMKRRAEELKEQKETEKRENGIKEEIKPEKPEKTENSGIKKSLPFILVGISAALVIAAVIIIVILANRKKVSDYLSVEAETGFLKIDTSLFGLSYNEFKDKIGVDDLMKPEEWPWWGHNMEIVHVDGGTETISCLFQNNHLVQVYRDSETESKGKMYDSAVAAYGNPTAENEYWSGYPEYEWKLTDSQCYYYQHVEVYENKGHYRQQYVSFDYKE